jgi:hypothetical protein
MKIKLVFSLLLFLSFQELVAQTTKVPLDKSSEKELEKATELLVTKYQMNADQKKQTYHILKRKAQNLAEVEALKNSDLSLYLAKLGHIQESTVAAIRRVLNNKEQVMLFKKTQSEVRKQRQAKQQELARNKKSKTEIDSAILNIYAE